MTDATVAIADRVRGVAAEKRFTQDRIAAVIDRSRTAVADRMSGRVPFTAPEIFSLAGAMKVDVARFFPEQTTAERAA